MVSGPGAARSGWLDAASSSKFSRAMGSGDGEIRRQGPGLSCQISSAAAITGREGGEAEFVQDHPATMTGALRREDPAFDRSREGLLGCLPPALADLERAPIPPDLVLDSLAALPEAIGARA